MTKQQEANVERFTTIYADEIEVFDIGDWIIIVKPYVANAALKILGNCNYVIEGLIDGRIQISIEK